ncbi:LysR family transcriptional regulator [Chlorobium sp. N1]|uniref:LysR family transcriptional regulator n=1 Tax=Chlorobium sp. N1 TaxID=2491138 RepID=UPI00103E58CC|nr:LysR family transcriptional regulator [Chlorobium sp. N1]TCD47215.1 LysR family transcriptional regulator [Chlorobium sp. N1]
MLDYRFEVFAAAARKLSFTRAAAELCITQPAVSKHIRELERTLKVQLFERKGNAIVLSEPGKLVLRYAESARNLSREMHSCLGRYQREDSGILALGASSTVAQYVLPPVLARFRQAFPQIRLKMATGNTGQIERMLLDQEIGIGVVEGAFRRSEIRYTPYTKDEIVLVVRTDCRLAAGGEVLLEQLKTLPLLLREQGSGTLQVIERSLREAGLRLGELSVEMSLGCTEAMKSYLLNADCLAFISRHAVARELAEGRLRIVRVRGIGLYRQLYFVTPQGRSGGLEVRFMEFALAADAGCHRSPVPSIT